MDSQQIKNVIEAALLGAGMPLSVAQLKDVFGGDDEEMLLTKRVMFAVIR